MEYLLLIYSNEKDFAVMPQAERERVTGAYMAYTQALLDGGVLRGGNRLRPTSATTTVRAAGGKMQTVDGPFAETREQLGGYYLIDVPDLDAALSWAGRCPGTQYGSIEVRPIWAM
ncbi:MAG TPA: YciI family protein [Acetobacteraceae bacterium]|nr:YciI family protein [Acetobacteraceae bacterium]